MLDVDYGLLLGSALLVTAFAVGGLDNNGGTQMLDVDYGLLFGSALLTTAFAVWSLNNYGGSYLSKRFLGHEARAEALIRLRIVGFAMNTLAVALLVAYFLSSRVDIGLGLAGVLLAVGLMYSQEIRTLVRFVPAEAMGPGPEAAEDDAD